MKDRAILALAVAVLGTSVFLILRAALFGLIDPPAYIFGCFFGALLSCYALAAPRRRPFASWLLPATGICLLTFAAIGAAHLLHRLPDWDYTVPAEARNLFLWAIIATSWWLIPLTAGVLGGISALLARMGPNIGADRPPG